MAVRAGDAHGAAVLRRRGQDPRCRPGKVAESLPFTALPAVLSAALSLPVTILLLSFHRPSLSPLTGTLPGRCRLRPGRPPPARGASADTLPSAAATTCRQDGERSEERGEWREAETETERSEGRRRRWEEGRVGGLGGGGEERDEGGEAQSRGGWDGLRWGVEGEETQRRCGVERQLAVHVGPGGEEAGGERHRGYVG